MKKDISDPLDEEELAQLDDFLLERTDVETSDRIAAAGGDEGIIDMSELDGFLTAIVSGPNSIMPSRWLPAVWGEKPPKWKSPDEFEAIFALIMRHLNSNVATLLQTPDQFEPMFNENRVEGKTYLVVDEWCVGYMRGIAVDADAWSQNDPQLATLLRPIRLWGTEEGWDLLNAMSEEDQARERDAISDAVRGLHQYWLSRRAPATPARRTTPKVGRNDPCPCSSGKKYKQCCLH